MKTPTPMTNQEYIQRIHALVDAMDGPIRIMEVCGTHTHAIARAGLRSVLPESLELISGPGCPVCVTAQEDIERMLLLAKRPDLILCTFGDMLRVPGHASSLERERSQGGDVRVVYSPMDAVDIARDNPDQEVVFLAVGFETTAPIVAATLQAAAQQNLKNFSLYTVHKRVPPAMEAVLQEEHRIQGFLTPGHVSVIIGADAYADIAENYSVPCVATGFDAEDILEGVVLLLEAIQEKRFGSFIQYRRAVSPEGNKKAQDIMGECFEITDAPWRGLGVLPESGLSLKKEWRDFDAASRFDLPKLEAAPPPGCRCGDVLRGRIQPRDCGLFGEKCTPRQPVGPCMVSSEGSCAARYRYEK
jgi:hydrogenase expression/formation protein HypD